MSQFDSYDAPDCTCVPAYCECPGEERLRLEPLDLHDLRESAYHKEGFDLSPFLELWNHCTKDQQ